MPEIQRRDLLKTIGLAGAASAFAGGAAWPRGDGARPRQDVELVTVFERGEADIHTYRIPAVVRATNGQILAFAEGRVENAEDWGYSRLVLKRSDDGGRTWGELQVVAEAEPDKVGNHVPVVDQTTGRIWVLFVRTALDDGQPVHESRRVYLTSSDDHGETWESNWRDITDDVKTPEMRQHYVCGPVHGIQLTKGDHPNRLVIPGNHTYRAGTDDSPPVVGIHVIYSDNAGEDWKLGGAHGAYDDGVVVPNETTVVELQDGTLYFNTRDQRGSAPGNRAATTSSDGGQTFDGPWEIVPDLVTPIVQGSLLEMTRDNDPDERIVFSAPGHPSSRERLTLWSSLDGTASWRESLVVYDGPAGYSDLVQILDGETRMLGVLFENGPRLSDDGALSYHRRVGFARVPLESLDRPIPPPATTPDTSGHGHTAIVSGSPAVVEGAFGNALRLAGDYVEVPYSAEVDLGSAPFTVALWFRTTRQELQRIVHAYNYDDLPQWLIDITPARVRGQLRTSSTMSSATHKADLTDGRWHHVAIRRGDQGALTLYVDGGSVATGDQTVQGSVSTNALAGIRVGARVDGINNPFVGEVDELYVFDWALNAAQIRALATDNTGPDRQPLLHLPLDDVR